VHGFRFQLDMERIQQSDTWALATREMRPWLLMLWAMAWEQRPAGSFTSDDAIIAARIGMDIRQFAAHRDILMRGWKLHSDGRIYHPVIAEQVIAHLEYRNREADRKRSYREKMSHGTDAGQTRDGAGRTRESGHQNQNQNQNQKREEGDNPPQPPLGGASAPKKPRTANPRPDDVIPEGVDAQAWADFTAHRREIRKPLTQLSASKNAEVLRAMSPQQQRAAVNSTVANRWAGVFPPKGNGQAKAGKTVTVDAFREMVARGEI
jgi:hypothetical protein